jgi:uracil-DNA glycosylase
MTGWRSISDHPCEKAGTGSSDLTMLRQDPGSRLSELDRLLDDIRTCRLCRDAPAACVLPHEPRPVIQASPTARILVAGQAPGTRVHKTGIPFNDPSGDRLRDWMGIGRDVFYDAARIAIVPMGFCFPGLDAKGGDLPPRPECAPRWRTRAVELLSQVELTLVIGQYAHKWHLGSARRASLTQTVRAWRDYTACKPGSCIVPLPHPSWRNNAWLGNNPWFEAEVLPFLRERVARLIA